jgi:hypothetical protein
LNVLVFGPVDLPKQRKVGERETPYLRQITHVSDATPQACDAVTKGAGGGPQSGKYGPAQ